MSAMDVIVTIIMGLAGYWIVSFLMGDRTPKQARKAPTRERPEAEGSWKEETYTRAEATVSEEPDKAPWYQVLEVGPEASPSMIKLAYRKLMSQYHPDKVASLGAELQQLAERKTREIQAAYELGMTLRGGTP
jgi:DnaJ like chaperone protein